VAPSRLRQTTLGLVGVFLVSACGASSVTSAPSLADGSVPPGLVQTGQSPAPSPGVAEIYYSGSTPATATPAAPTPASNLPWSLDLFSSSGVRHQDPYDGECTASAVVMALNMAETPPPLWTFTTRYSDMQQVFAYERAHMMAPPWSPGSDPLGTVTALNDLGFGRRVYVDRGYGSVDEAARAIVMSIARTRKPAMIFMVYGGHVQLVTGYEVRGEDPEFSDNFAVIGFYMTDPLIGYMTVVGAQSSRLIPVIDPDTYVSLDAWKWGGDAVRFSQYQQVDGGVNPAWYGKYVAILATS
jgi:hypothetical protein